MGMDLERAVAALYEDESLTDELDDTAASALLRWASGYLNLLVGRYTQRAEFEAAFKVLRVFTKRVNRLVGRNAQLDTDAVHQQLIKLAEAAAELGTAVPEARLAAYLQAREALSVTEAITMLTDWLNPHEGSSEHDTPTRPVRGADSLATLPPGPDAFHDAPTRPVRWGDDESTDAANSPESDS